MNNSPLIYCLFIIVVLGFTGVSFSTDTVPLPKACAPPSGQSEVGKRDQSHPDKPRNWGWNWNDNNRGKEHRANPADSFQQKKNNSQPRQVADSSPANRNRFPEGRNFQKGENAQQRKQWYHRDMQELKENDPVLYELISKDFEFEAKLRFLSGQYRKTADSDKKLLIRKEIEQTCAGHFEVRQQKRELELQRMREWLQQLEAGAKKSRENKQLIIERRIKSLLGEGIGEY